MKILVCGGRDFSDYSFLSSTLESINPTQIISGGARGKDRGGRGTDDMVRGAIRHGVKVIRPNKE